MYIYLHGCLSMTTGFMPSHYDNHQAKKDIGEIEKIEKYSQKSIYNGIARISFCMCVCVV